MLAELNVKDIALIREAGVEFGPGLNILTGETGAGKSVIIGSALLSLGGKARTDMIREGADSAYTELVFTVTDPEKQADIAACGVEVPEDGTLVFGRKITEGRSVSRINGETVSLNVLKSVATQLIDIYGQNEYHALFDSASHLRYLDAFLGRSSEDAKRKVAEAYGEWRKKKEKLEGFGLDEAERLRELSLCEYEIEEITEAKLKEGEEEELESLYRKLNNGKNLEESLSRADSLLGEMRLSETIREVEEAGRYDESLSEVRKELIDAQSILEDVRAGIHRYVSDLDLSDRLLAETESRLDKVRNLEAKYGRTVEDVNGYLENRKQRRDELEAYEENRKKAEKELKESFRVLKSEAELLTGLRKKGAEEFCVKIREELLDLGFVSVKIRMDFSEKEPGPDGQDTVCFMVALNPGEAEKPLSQVASGGELSRVMLSIKTVIASNDATPTLIFDEIDAGISGRTAQKVAEKLDLIATSRQVICITHLPQIASMADRHFVITKEERDGRNVTGIRVLEEKESEEELARLLGGAKVTEAVLKNAAEMKSFAAEIKKEHRKNP